MAYFVLVTIVDGIHHLDKILGTLILWDGPFVKQSVKELASSTELGNKVHVFFLPVHFIKFYDVGVLETF